MICICRLLVFLLHNGKIKDQMYIHHTLSFCNRDRHDSGIVSYFSLQLLAIQTTCLVMPIPPCRSMLSMPAATVSPQKGFSPRLFWMSDWYRIIVAKQRIEQELDLLHARKQTIDLSAASSGKVKKKNAKKGVNVRQQKKLAKALAIADKEEFKVEKAVTKAEKRKARKMVWTWYHIAWRLNKETMREREIICLRVVNYTKRVMEFFLYTKEWGRKFHMKEERLKTKEEGGPKEGEVPQLRALGLLFTGSIIARVRVYVCIQHFLYGKT